MQPLRLYASLRTRLYLSLAALAFITAAFTSCSMAEHFNETAADPTSKAQLVIKTIHIKPGTSVADIGAGGGYFSYLFSETVGKTGVVYAVDINEKYLQFIKQKAAQKKLTNIQTVKATENKTNLPAQVDIAFLRNVYHHLNDRPGYFLELKKKLKPGARVVIVEYNKEASFWHSLFGHSTDAELISQEMQSAGYELVAEHKLLTKQSFLVFTPSSQ